MIYKENLTSLFEELNVELKKVGNKRELIIYGGAALIAMNIPDRATIDVDVFVPKLDDSLIHAIQVIGKRRLFDEHWMNSTGAAFVKELPIGWQQRVTPFYSGSHLHVSTLGRIDMIFTKILAELDRQEDLQDILHLRPTRQEIETIRKSLLKLEANHSWERKVSSLLKVLLNEQ